MILCHQTGKHSHKSSGAAEAQLRGLVQRKGYDGHVYPCIYCQGWHVGRRKKNTHRNKYLTSDDGARGRD